MIGDASNCLRVAVTVTPNYDQSQYNTRMKQREEPLGFDVAEAQPLKVNSSLIMFITVTPNYDQSQYNTRMKQREEPLGFDVAEAQPLKVNSSLIIFISFRHVFFLFLFFHSFFLQSPVRSPPS